MGHSPRLRLAMEQVQDLRISVSPTTRAKTTGNVTSLTTSPDTDVCANNYGWARNANKREVLPYMDMKVLELVSSKKSLFHQLVCALDGNQRY